MSPRGGPPPRRHRFGTGPNGKTPSVGQRAEHQDLLDAMKRAAEVLRRESVSFALGGGIAVYARGGRPSEHDVDFILREEDADRSLAALDAAGFRTERPPEDWLVKAYDGDTLVDLIFRPVGLPVTDQTLDDTDVLPVAAITVPVISGTQLMVHSLLTLTSQRCDLTDALALVRAIREQIDVERVRAETKHSPYARAFLQLAEDLSLLGGSP
jgi:hypothetical protein